MPKTFARLQAALALPSVTAGEIADIVGTDAAIATKVLQITNSAFFRLRKPMVRIKDAVTYLGFATVRNLVLCAEISSSWESPLELPEVDPQDLQKHAEYSAAACKALAGGRVSPDDAWLAGLLHDIGYWILVQECPEQLAQAIALSKAEAAPLSECEIKTIGASHAQMGAYLLGLWGLPYPIVEAVALHHTPGAITPHGYDLLAALAVAHTLMEPSNGRALPRVSAAEPSVDAGYLERTGAPFDWEEAQRRVLLSSAPAD
jgi:HD-like signal output (HDOD) protein